MADDAAIDLELLGRCAHNAACVVLALDERPRARRLASTIARQRDVVEWLRRERFALELAEYMIACARVHAFGPEHEPRAVGHSGWYQRMAVRREGEELLEVLRAHGGNVARAARALGMGRTTLWERLRRHGIRLEEGAASGRRVA